MVWMLTCSRFSIIPRAGASVPQLAKTEVQAPVRSVSGHRLYMMTAEWRDYISTYM